MVATLQKWGNSLALRIPKAVARQMGVEEGSSLLLKVDAESLVVRSAKPRYKIADLVRRIEPANRHSESDWGRPTGKETW